VLLKGMVNPAEPHWFGINIQGNWNHHHLIELMVRDEGKPFAAAATMDQSNTVNCIQSVHNRIKHFKSQSMQFFWVALNECHTTSGCPEMFNYY